MILWIIDKFFSDEHHCCIWPCKSVPGLCTWSAAACISPCSLLLCVRAKFFHDECHHSAWSWWLPPHFFTWSGNHLRVFVLFVIASNSQVFQWQMLLPHLVKLAGTIFVCVECSVTFMSLHVLHFCGCVKTRTVHIKHQSYLLFFFPLLIQTWFEIILAINKCW